MSERRSSGSETDSGSQRVPAPVAALLRRVLPARDVGAVLGDLAEAARRRPSGARRVLWMSRQAASLVLWSLLDRDRLGDRLILPGKKRPLSNLLFELRAALRGLRRAPGFAVAMVATVAIGVGGSTVVFALVHGVLLAPLEYPQPQRLAAVWPDSWVSKALFRELQARAGLVEGLAAWSGGARVVGGDGEPELLLGPQVSAGFLRTLGYTPMQGRFLRPEDNEPGATPVVVLTDELFRERYGADPSLVGRTIELDGEGWVVVGVLPPGAKLLQPGAQMVTPLRMDPSVGEYAGSNYLKMVGRLADGVTLEQAAAELARLVGSLKKEYELSDAQVASARVSSLQEYLVGDRRPLLTLLLAAVGLVLVVACVNAGNLTLARQLSRRTEVAVRSALGGGRARGLVFLGSESLLLAAAGGLAGTALAAWALALIRATRPLDLPRLAEVRLSPVVLAVSVGVTGATALAAGLFPALRTTRLDAADALRSGRGASMGPGTRLAREGLVVLEVALAVLLVAGAALMGRSLWELARVDPGFEAQGRLMLQLVPPVQGPGADLDPAGYYERILASVRGVPGVESAATVNVAPVRGGGWVMGTMIEGMEPVDSLPLSYWRVVSPEYFDTLGAHLREGRPLRDSDVAGAPAVAVVNQTFARRYWPDQEPLGKRFRIPWETDEWIEVVGVVADIRHQGIGSEAPATVYRPLRQGAAALRAAGVTGQALVLHTRGAALESLAAVREAIHDADPTVPIVEPASMRSVVRESVAEPRLLLQILAVFAGAALILSGVGIAGAISHLVRQRRREFGIRQALGARPAQIFGSSLGRGFVLGAAGLGVGTAAALALGPLMQSFLFQVQPRDPFTLLVVVAVLGLCVGAASWIPSRRAARIDPCESLRAE